jgi:hypothetical protein
MVLGQIEGKWLRDRKYFWSSCLFIHCALPRAQWGVSTAQDHPPQRVLKSGETLGAPLVSARAVKVLPPVRYPHALDPTFQGVAKYRNSETPNCSRASNVTLDTVLTQCVDTQRKITWLYTTDYITTEAGARAAPRKRMRRSAHPRSASLELAGRELGQPQKTRDFPRVPGRASARCPRGGEGRAAARAQARSRGGGGGGLFRTVREASGNGAARWAGPRLYKGGAGGRRRASCFSVLVVLRVGAFAVVQPR